MTTRIVSAENTRNAPGGKFPPNVCFLGLGANLGDRSATLRAAILALDSHERIFVNGEGGIASLYETAPVGCGDEQPKYLNSVIRIDTTLSPAELLAVTMSIEQGLGRVRESRWGARVIDIDMLLFGDRSTFENPRGLKPRGSGSAAAGGQLVSLSSCRWVVEETADLALPHPRICERRFVLEPLAEIGGDVVHPVANCTIGELATLAARNHGDQTISRIAGPEWVQPVSDAGEMSNTAK